jgi:hypothetical protein
MSSMQMSTTTLKGAQKEVNLDELEDLQVGDVCRQAGVASSRPVQHRSLNYS